MKKIVLGYVMVMMSGLSATAALGEANRDWAEGPVRFLMTDSERQEWAGIEDDAAAEAFVELFWARRDPDLQTRENEFRVEFDQRVQYADAEFGEEELRGALTDRGKTLILLGPPTEHGFAEIGEYLARLYRTGRPPVPSASDTEAHIQMQGVSFNLNKGRADLWGYSREAIPTGIEWPTKSDLISFAFFDHEGNGQFRMQLGIRKAAEAAQVLKAAPAALVVHPELQAPPVFGLIPGIPSASIEELSWLDSGRPMEDVVATVAPGAAGPGVDVEWLALRIPADADRPNRIIGRLTHDGVVIGSFRIENSGKEEPLGVLYEAALPVPVGPSILEVGLAGDEGPIHVERFELDGEPTDGAFVTPVFAGAAVTKLADAAAGDPFVFGGYHLMTRPDGRYLQGENLALFCLLVVPDAETGPRNGTVRMRWYVDGKPTASQPSQAAQFVPGGTGIWVWGTQLPLESLSRDHRYELKITVKDTETGASSTTRIPVVFED